MKRRKYLRLWSVLSAVWVIGWISFFIVVFSVEQHFNPRLDDVLALTGLALLPPAAVGAAIFLVPWKTKLVSHTIAATVVWIILFVVGDDDHLRMHGLEPDEGAYLTSMIGGIVVIWMIFGVFLRNSRLYPRSNDPLPPTESGVGTADAVAAAAVKKTVIPKTPIFARHARRSSNSNSTTARITLYAQNAAEQKMQRKEREQFFDRDRAGRLRRKQRSIQRVRSS